MTKQEAAELIALFADVEEVDVKDIKKPVFEDKGGHAKEVIYSEKIVTCIKTGKKYNFKKFHGYSGFLDAIDPMTGRTHCFNLINVRLNFDD